MKLNDKNLDKIHSALIELYINLKLDKDGKIVSKINII